MAPLIVPNGIRVSINGETGTHPFSCVYGGLVTGLGSGLGLAQDIANSWIDNILPNLCDDVSFKGATWVDLRSTSGDSGPVPDLPGSTDGGNSDSMTSPAVCFLVHWQVPGGRNTKNGRSYLPGVSEAAVGPSGVLSGSGIVDLQDDILTFLQDVTEGDNGDVSVISVPRDGTPASRSIVTGVLDTTVATQRRRQRR